MLTVLTMVTALQLQGLADRPTRVFLSREAPPRQVLLAQAPDKDVIETNTGQTHVGRIVDENKAGYVFQPDTGSASFLIEYSQVRSVKRASAGAPPPAPTAAPLAPSAPTAVTARLDEVEARLAQARIELDRHPTGGGVAALVLGIIGLVGCTPWVILIGPAIGGTIPGLGALGLIFIIADVIAFGALVFGIVMIAINGGPRRKLILEIESLEETRDRLIRTNSAAPPLPPQGILPPALAPTFAFKF